MAQPKQTPKKGFLFGILLVVIVVILVFGALNYFNILRLSEIFPNYLSFLPHKQSKQFVSPTGRLNNVTLNLRTKLSCPSVKAFCEKGQGVVKDQYVGLGYRLPSGSPIFAAFDGNLTVGKTPDQQNFKIVYLDNPSFSLRAIYLFRGPRAKIKTGQVFKGQQVAEAGGKTISIYDNNSLIFSLIPGYPGSTTPTILNKGDFEQN